MVAVAGGSVTALGLDGSEASDIEVGDDLRPRRPVWVTAHRGDGTSIAFDAVAGVETPVEGQHLHHGGILHLALRRMAAPHGAARRREGRTRTVHDRMRPGHTDDLSTGDLGN